MVDPTGGGGGLVDPTGGGGGLVDPTGGGGLDDDDASDGGGDGDGGLEDASGGIACLRALDSGGDGIASAGLGGAAGGDGFDPPAFGGGGDPPALGGGGGVWDVNDSSPPLPLPPRTPHRFGVAAAWITSATSATDTNAASPNDDDVLPRFRCNTAMIPNTNVAIAMDATTVAAVEGDGAAPQVVVMIDFNLYLRELKK